MNQNIRKGLYQFVMPAFLAAATFGAGCGDKGGLGTVSEGVNDKSKTATTSEQIKVSEEADVILTRESYTIRYQDKKFGLVEFTKYYEGTSASRIRLELGDVGVEDVDAVILKDFGCDGLVDKIIDVYGEDEYYDLEYTNLMLSLLDKGYNVQTPKSELEQKKALLEKRFEKANKILAQFTTTGELADLIKKAEAEWRGKYKFPENDPLDKYLN